MGGDNLITTDWYQGNFQFLESPAGSGGQVHFGKDTYGVDVKLFGATTGAFAIWDESADKLIFDKSDLQFGDSDELRFGDLAAGDIVMNFDGTNFEIEGAAAATTFLIGADSKLLNATLKGALTVGKNDTGHDVKFFGATSGKYALWDESENTLVISGATTLGGTVTIGGDQTLQGAGTGADGFLIKNPKNAAAGTLTGTALNVEVSIGGTAYYFPIYPNKT